MSKLSIVCSVNYSVRVICRLLKVLCISLLLILIPIRNLTVNMLLKLLIFFLSFESPRTVDVYAFPFVQNSFSHFDVCSVYRTQLSVYVVVCVHLNVCTSTLIVCQKLYRSVCDLPLKVLGKLRVLHQSDKLCL